MRARLAAFAAAACAMQALALDSAQWPPPAPVESRMHELQLVIIAPDSTAAQREAAREELSGLLKSPAGQVRGRTPGEKPPRPARAAIDPYPSVVQPAIVAPAPPPPGAGIAHVEVLAPPKISVNPHTGSIASPSGGVAIDPRTGQVLHEAGDGFIDPRTGRLTPR